MRAVRRAAPSTMLAALIILAAFMPVISGCGASTREKTIATAFLATNAARDGFVEFDAKRQLAIVDVAKTKEEGQAALFAYRTARAQIIELFEAVYYAISAASVLKNDPKSMPALIDAAKKLQAGLDGLRASPALAP